MTCVGLDLTSSPGKPTACAAVDDRLALILLTRLRPDSEILNCLRPLHPEVVAIDAPLFLPLGLCCLEERCACSQRLPRPGRVAEHVLYSQGISVYPVTKKTFIKELIYRGISLAKVLRAEGYEVIEVYPYATKVRLFGRPIPRKGTAAGRLFLGEKLPAIIPGLPPASPALSHDDGDALLAAYTAWLYRQEMTEAIGHPEEGLVHLPKPAPDASVFHNATRSSMI